MPSPSVFTLLINSYLPEPQASLLNGIIFGVPLKTSGVFYQELKKVGLLHLVVLSGMNITLLASTCACFTNFLGKKLSILISILTVIIFIIFVGPQAPVIRAGIMGILTLVAILYERPSFAFYSLFFSFLLIACIWPCWISSVSLHLSYGAAFGLILFSKRKQVFFLDEIKTSFSAQIFTAPMIFFYFKQISLVAPLSNLLVSFLIAPLMVLGFITAILGKINYHLGILPAYLCYGLLSYIVFIVKTLSKLPFVYFKF